MTAPGYKSIPVQIPVAGEFDEWRRELESVLKRRVYATEVFQITLDFVRGKAAQIVDERKTVSVS